MEIASVELFLHYYRRIRDRTEAVAQCVPADAVEWRPDGWAWSCGDLIRHIGALERWMFAENVTGRESRYPGHGRDLADGRDGVLAYLARMQDEAAALIGSLDDAALGTRCRTPGGAELPVWKWLRAMIEHQVHHRGQLYLLLRMQHVDTPPLYGLSSEDVRARSLPVEP